MRCDCNSYEKTHSDEADGSNVFMETFPKAFISEVGKWNIVRTGSYHIYYGIWGSLSSGHTLMAIAWIISFDQGWRYMLSWNTCSAKWKKIRKLRGGKGEKYIIYFNIYHRCYIFRLDFILGYIKQKIWNRIFSLNVDWLSVNSDKQLHQLSVAWYS